MFGLRLPATAAHSGFSQGVAAVSEFCVCVCVCVCVGCTHRVSGAPQLHGQAGHALICESCDRAYDLACVGLRGVPAGRWRCDGCCGRHGFNLDNEATATSVEFFLNVKFETEGTYWVEILLDRDIKVRYPLKAKQVTGQGQGPGQA